MRLFTIFLSIALLGNAGAQTFEPPASLAGLQIEFVFNDGETSSVPPQDLFGSDGYAQTGFSGSVLERIPYTYAQGVITYTDWGEEIRLNFSSATSGTFEYYEVDYPTPDGGPNVIGTFTVVTPTLVLKSDWQRTETMNSPLSTDYWNVWRRTVDSVTYDDGELSFIFANSTQDYYADTEIPYGRTLPMNENWQVVLEDIYAAPGLSNFQIGVELNIAVPEFQCELSFKDYGNGREFGVFLEQQRPSGDWDYASAYVSASEDTRISSGGNVRILHVASSRDLIIEYQPDGASDWSELARLNLESGSFQSENGYGNLTGDLISTTDHRMSVEIEAEAGVATQLADLEIAGIKIGSYTPPVWELYDDFSGSALDADKWDLAYWDGGNSPTLSSGRALLSGNTVSNWNATQVTEAMLQANANAASLVGGDNEAHSLLEFKDSGSISGIEMQLTLPEDVADNIGIGLYAIDYNVMFNNPNEDPIRFDMDLWKSSGASPEVQITWKDPVSGLEQSATSAPVAAGQTVLLKFERTADTIRFFVNDAQIAESDYSRQNETFIIRAISEAEDSLMAYVDNVRVLRDTPQEARWEPAGWVYYAWPYAYDFTQGRWHFFNQSDKQWRVNLGSGDWGTLDAATGWNYYAWPYSYSSDQGAWHWYNANTQWVVDLASGEWELFGGSD